MAAADDGESYEAPESVPVPVDAIGNIIGRGGSVIKRLIHTTGCKIEVPKTRSDDSTNIIVRLTGGTPQRAAAYKALKDVIDGGGADAAEDHAAKAEGALVLMHGLDDFDRRAWLAWKMIPVEHEHGVRVDTGQRAVRIYRKVGKVALLGVNAEKVRSSADAAIAGARELLELTVDAQLDKDPENANFDGATLPIVIQHGVLVRVPRPENGACPIRVVGPAEPARDVAELLEARYCKGKATASILIAEGQLDAMETAMQEEFAKDVEAVEEEQRVKVNLGSAVIWLSGNTANTVEAARQTIVDMLQFYVPSGFLLLKDMKRSLIERLRDDEELRALAQRPGTAVAFDITDGTVWICGQANRDAVKDRVNVVVAKYVSEHWEYDLEDYGTAMWLLGPRGSGEWLGRMQSESGARIIIDANNLKAIVEGAPTKVEAGKCAVLKGIQQLRKKKEIDEEKGGRQMPAVKPLLSDVPDNMKKVMEKLKELEAKEAWKRQQARIQEWEHEAAAMRGGAGGAGGGGGGGGGGTPPATTTATPGGPQGPQADTRERSRSRDRAV